MEKYETPDGRVQLYHGDCLEIMPTFPEKSIDMVLCDPPYGTTACKWDSVIPFEPMWSNYKRLSVGAIVLFGSQPFTSTLVCSNLKDFKYCWVWVKNRPTGAQHSKNRPMRKVEDVAVFSSKPMGHVSLLGAKRMMYNPQGVASIGEKMVKARGFHGNHIGPRPNQVGRVYEAFTGFPSDLLTFDKEESHQHPTQKPVALCEYLIKTYTHENFTVLDNCMGSGTTGVACINTDRKFIGIEKEEKYFEIAKKRIQDAWDKKYCN